MHSVADMPWNLIDLECSEDYFSDCDETEFDQKTEVAEGLRTWVVDSGIPKIHVHKLLHVLKPVLPELPLTAETLLKTKQTVQCSSMSGGDYVYLGLRDSLCQLVADNTGITELHLALNIDGVPLFSSSKYSLWPVLCYVMNVKAH